MGIGPGKYDEACTAARKATKGRAVLLIVIEGASGSGFSVQSEPGHLAAVPWLLRDVASSIEREFKKG
jgi:hypothetical protein